MIVCPQCDGYGKSWETENGQSKYKTCSLCNGKKVLPDEDLQEINGTLKEIKAELKAIRITLFELLSQRFKKNLFPLGEDYETHPNKQE